MRFKDSLSIYLAGLSIAVLVGGFVFPAASDQLWLALAAAVLVPEIWRMLRDMLRGNFGVDIIAAAAIAAALMLHDFLPAAVIAVMLMTGMALEDYADRRAKRDLTALLARAPKTAHLKDGDQLTDIDAAKLKPGDKVLVKPGEQIPADGVVLSGHGLVDESALTGESLPRTVSARAKVYGGSVSQDSVFEVRVTAGAADSQYGQIVRLVEQAVESKAPLVRLADRYSVFFTVVTFALAAAAIVVSHEPMRALAVLVVATPCPLLIAAPVAVVAGMNRAARAGVIIKNGGILERLGEADIVVFDKTGTLTMGDLAVSDVVTFHGAKPDHVLAAAASLDQLSEHVIARAIVKAARAKELRLDYPAAFKEIPGEGVAGKVFGKTVHLGNKHYISRAGAAVSVQAEADEAELRRQGKLLAYVSESGRLIGAVVLSDEMRPGTKRLFRRLKRMGIKRMIMLTGDHREAAEVIAAQAGITEVEADLLPADKVRKINQLNPEGMLVMAGDGINDAPALAAADVGIAMGYRGAQIAAESADVVISVDSIARVGEAISISRRTLAVAKQSIWFGIGLSLVLMVLAFAGHIRPVAGSVMQEGIDFSVILFALRARR